MLRKLLKYEFRSTARLFLPFFGAVILLAGLNRLIFLIAETGAFNNNETLNGLVSILMGLIVLLYCLVLCASCCVPFVVLLYRFNTTLLKDEGYLMHTLPVTTHQLLWSKLISGIVWLIASAVFATLSLLVILSGEPLQLILELWHYVDFTVYLQNLTTLDVVLFSVEYLLLVAVSLPLAFLMFFLPITFGASRPKNKILYGFGAYLAINFIYETATTVLSYLVLLLFNFNNSSNITTSIHVSLFLTLGISIVVAVLLYMGTYHLLGKKLNLE